MRLFAAALVALASSVLSTDFAYAKVRLTAIPAFNRPVVDVTETLSEDAKVNIEKVIGGFQSQTSSQIAVLMVDAFSNEGIDAYAERVFRKWKPGLEGRDNGVLLVIAKDQREVRIEVGYGLEGALSDVRTSEIIHEILIPNLRQGRYEEAVDQAVRRIIALTEGETFTTPKPKQRLFVVVRRMRRWINSTFNVNGSWEEGVMSVVYFFFPYLPIFMLGVRGRSVLVWFFLLPFSVIPLVIAGFPALVFFGVMQVLLYPLAAATYESKVMQWIRRFPVGSLKADALIHFLESVTPNRPSGGKIGSKPIRRNSASPSDVSSSNSSSSSSFEGGGGGRSGGGGASGQW